MRCPLPPCTEYTLLLQWFLTLFTACPFGSLFASQKFLSLSLSLSLSLHSLFTLFPLVMLPTGTTSPTSTLHERKRLYSGPIFAGQIGQLHHLQGKNLRLRQICEQNHFGAANRSSEAKKGERKERGENSCNKVKVMQHHFCLLFLLFPFISNVHRDNKCQNVHSESLTACVCVRMCVSSPLSIAYVTHSYFYSKLNTKRHTNCHSTLIHPPCPMAKVLCI